MISLQPEGSVSIVSIIASSSFSMVLRDEEGEEVQVEERRDRMRGVVLGISVSSTPGFGFGWGREYPS